MTEAIFDWRLTLHAWHPLSLAVLIILFTTTSLSAPPEENAPHSPTLRKKLARASRCARYRAVNGRRAGGLPVVFIGGGSSCAAVTGMLFASRNGHIVIR
jgi:hypothetical protein